ncbi:cryptochrome/photolyase family protein [Actinorugispora endophytica]|uniref:Deoxyribodipyrimidine photo-lyase n=1 Tax=Actinorugispora endophytica TaxID=1605990 RepID=A0A4R6V6A6_9ACTN|nr:deoxyribodipyrimidine photo-lyase [Actinorugispora endophytica]TDQ54712.1 deoxyribodipyrimidine photo-lyase [Actinorugispora endophytica]
MSTIVVLFTRDLRLHDHPALHAAVTGAERVVPLFVLDPAVLGACARNRIAYLVEALAELRAGLRGRGGDLVVREGDTVAETTRIAAETGAAAVHVSGEVGASAAARELDLARALGGPGVRLRVFPGVTVVPPGALTPSGGDHYRVFTPYLRAWESAAWRAALPAPDRVAIPSTVAVGRLPGPSLAGTGTGTLSPDRTRGGEDSARDRVRAWTASALAGYEGVRDDLSGDRTSRLSGHLRFGCVSPLELALVARNLPGGTAFLRRLAWRDFHHQAAHARRWADDAGHRPRDTDRRTDEDGFAAWCSGRTGAPVVDAGMRQLLREGFMHNRARMITANYLTRLLSVPWRRGADHFHSLLVDGDLANNHGNWRWIAGTGDDTRSNRRFNLLRQARRFDPDGSYVRRYVPELRGISGPEVHTPPLPAPGGYPPPLLPEP